MAASNVQIVVAGHICLDVIPTFQQGGESFKEMWSPGKLLNVGAALLSTGGAVSNTGLALHRLGLSTRLMGKVGDDLFGRAILDIVRAQSPTLAEGMLVKQGEESSYTIVISPPDVDRIFLHCPGCNDTFEANDVQFEQVAGARYFHFGYPPLMRRMYTDDGIELATIFQRAKACGMISSLDMAQPDPTSPAGKVDWPQLLRRVLPFVDVFLPSVDEILFMLAQACFAERRDRPKDGIEWDMALLGVLSEQLLQFGTAVVVIKLGNKGLYVRTTDDASRFANGWGTDSRPMEAWRGRELFAPCFQVDVVGTTGSGDATIAGLLAGLIHKLPPEDVITVAVAVGACSVEAADATSGVLGWNVVLERVAAGWERCAVDVDLSDGVWDEQRCVWYGPHDTRRERVQGGC